MDTKESTTGSSRRDVVKAGVTMMAAPVMVTAGAALADAGREGTGRPEPPLANPRAEYPHPPFPDQQQPWPGLVINMNPRPDHGEKSYQGAGRLTGRKALITGGDSGIGRAAAIAFAREGADVAINYVPAEEPDAKEVVDLIKAAGRKAVALPGDIRSEDFCRKLVADAAHALGGLDILVNNAAYQQAHAKIEELTTESFDSTFKTNIYAMFWITKAAMQFLQPGSAIINTASVQAFKPSGQLLDYASTKGAIVAFTQALARQLASRGIRVNAVAPGPFWTPLQTCGGQLPGMVKKFGEDSPLGRPGQPAELAATYVLLADERSSYTSGEIVGATGGSPLP